MTFQALVRSNNVAASISAKITTSFLRPPAEFSDLSLAPAVLVTLVALNVIAGSMPTVVVAIYALMTPPPMTVVVAIVIAEAMMVPPPEAAAIIVVCF